MFPFKVHMIYNIIRISRDQISGKIEVAYHVGYNTMCYPFHLRYIIQCDASSHLFNNIPNELDIFSVL